MFNLNLLAMSLNDDDFISLFGVFIGPILPLMISGETMWIDARTVATLQERTGDRFMVHARKRNGIALVSRVPSRIRSGGKRSPYDSRFTPKHRAALREANFFGMSLGSDDEWAIRDRFSPSVSAHEMLFGAIDE